MELEGFDITDGGWIISLYSSLAVARSRPVFFTSRRNDLMSANNWDEETSGSSSQWMACSMASLNSLICQPSLALVLK
jgi:hypothetical protein